MDWITIAEIILVLLACLLMWLMFLWFWTDGGFSALLGAPAALCLV